MISLDMLLIVVVLSVLIFYFLFFRIQAVGCDQILGSKASPDACGICKGDNSTCKFFKGQYTLQHRANGKPFIVFVLLVSL